MAFWGDDDDVIGEKGRVIFFVVTGSMGHGMLDERVGGG